MNKTNAKKSKQPVILIVDDVPRNIQVLGALLNKLDFELAVAMNGQQALDTVSKIKPDLILLDVMMPVMDGHEVCRRLKKNEETKDIPIIFITAKSESEDIITGFELGAVDYITKPFIGSELIARVKTHLALKTTKETLQEEVVTKNKFFSIISHDLRGSFGIILSFVQLIQENREYLSPDELNELLDDIGKTSKNTLNLLENLLEWARSQTGRINYNPEELKVHDLSSNIIQSLQEIASNKEIQLTSDVNMDYEAFADKNMVLLVIRNLVSNAIKFTPKKGNIKINCSEDDNFIKVAVTDSGIGIENDKIENLFKIDMKVSTLGTENEQGNGLGLVLCKEFVEHNGGEIGIDSKLNKGTTVWFTLPKTC
ncbi:response regulator [Maribellus comscasis]|uniref:histidine kinase n=1 Tax=Maribellus comscasis TaxID=2681766 RepID=A0A6I6JMZ6_9BACT|nr:hybrid sensor histidine kinase/response regulator [Maribellus comscasis]QGY44326.1 response regulator [Maribellus comscasis]